MKKLLCMLLTLIMVLSMPVYIVAEGDDEPVLVAAEPVRYEDSKSEILEDYIEDMDKFEKSLAKQFSEFTTSLDVSEFGIPYTSECFRAIQNFICEEMGEYFYVNLGRYSGYIGSIMVSIEVYNVCTAETYSEHKAKWDAEVDRLLDGIKDNDKLTDVQKALLIHDRLAVHCEYDKERLANGTVPTESYMAYGTIVNRISVCEGYAEAYCYLLDLVGIDSYLVSSEKLIHEWNIVEIGDEEYHVDVTWDDPTMDMGGRVKHDNFLLSTSEFRKSHKANDYDDSPDDNRFKDAFWINSNSAFCLVGDEIYYIDSKENALKNYDGEVLAKTPDYWPAPGMYIWPGCYARTATDGENLYVSFPEAIYKYDTETKELKEFVKPEQTFGNDFSIFGFYYYDGIFSCEYSTTPNYTNDTKKNYTITFEIGEPKTTEVRGQVTFSIPRVPATIELVSDGTVVYTLETEVVDKVGFETQEFRFMDVVPGTYDLVINKDRHLSYKICGIVVGEELVNLTTNSNPEIAAINLVVGDSNGDSVVDIKDVIALTSDDTYNKSSADAGCLTADYNGDGLFDINDLIIVTSDNNYNKGEKIINY